MSWGELSCAHYHAKEPCPNPDVSYVTCRPECPYYKREERKEYKKMSWGEKSCVFITGGCPSPDASYETCNLNCPHYKKCASDTLVDSLPRSIPRLPPVVLQVKKVCKKKRRRKRC